MEASQGGSQPAVPDSVESVPISESAHGFGWWVPEVWGLGGVGTFVALVVTKLAILAFAPVVVVAYPFVRVRRADVSWRHWITYADEIVISVVALFAGSRWMDPTLGDPMTPLRGLTHVLIR